MPTRCRKTREERLMWRPEKERTSEYYTLTETVPAVLAVHGLAFAPDEEDMPLLPEVIRRGQGEGQLYGQGMHHFIDEYNADPCEPKEIMDWWRGFWTRWIVTHATCADGKVAQSYINHGNTRAKHDLERYLALVLKRKEPIKPDNSEVLFKDVYLRRLGFHLTFQIDQLPQASDGSGREDLFELKFDNCSRDEFWRERAPRYEKVLQLQTAGYREEQSMVGGPPEASSVLWHPPSESCRVFHYTDEELGQARVMYKKAKSRYKKQRDQARREAANQALHSRYPEELELQI